MNAHNPVRGAESVPDGLKVEPACFDMAADEYEWLTWAAAHGDIEAERELYELSMGRTERTVARIMARSERV